MDNRDATSSGTVSRFAKRIFRGGFEGRARNSGNYTSEVGVCETRSIMVEYSRGPGSVGSRDLYSGVGHERERDIFTSLAEVSLRVRLLAVEL